MEDCVSSNLLLTTPTRGTGEYQIRITLGHLDWLDINVSRVTNYEALPTVNQCKKTQRVQIRNCNTYSCMWQSLKASSWRKAEDCDRPSSDILLNHKPTNLFILGTNQGHIMRKPQEQYYNVCYLSKLVKTLGLLLGVENTGYVTYCLYCFPCSFVLLFSIVLHQVGADLRSVDCFCTFPVLVVQ